MEAPSEEPFVQDKLAQMWGNVGVTRQQHKFFLDQGMKFGIAHKSPLIKTTDLFELDKFGCWTKSHKTLVDKFADAKKWWRHPSMVFGLKLNRVGIHLADLTTGEVRWDAIYDLSHGAPHKFFDHDKKIRDMLKQGATYPKYEYFLSGEERPIGGNHPFFQPDWCPPPGDALAHKFRLTVTNLGQVQGDFCGGEEKICSGPQTVGEIFFTQYGPTQLANTYAYERGSDGSCVVQ